MCSGKAFWKYDTPQYTIRVMWNMWVFDFQQVVYRALFKIFLYTRKLISEFGFIVTDGLVHHITL